MKKFVVSAFVFVSAIAAAQQSYPQLYFSYGYLFDDQCAQKTGFKIDPAWSQETFNRLAEFQAAWDKEAPAIVGTMVKTVGRPFKRHELSVALTVCNFVPMSDPFLVNVKWFLRSFRQDPDTQPIYGFVDVTFHELIHNYLVESFDFNRSSLLYKYRNETGSVLAHLHLMALQKSVYIKLKRPEMLEWLKFFYNRIAADYARSWKIVDQLEDYNAFVQEVIDLKKP